MPLLPAPCPAAPASVPRLPLRPPPAASAGRGHGSRRDLSQHAPQAHSKLGMPLGPHACTDEPALQLPCNRLQTHAPPFACLQLCLLAQCILLQPRHHRSNLLVPLRSQLAAQRSLPPLHLPPRALAGRRPPCLLWAGNAMTEWAGTGHWRAWSPFHCLPGTVMPLAWSTANSCLTRFTSRSCCRSSSACNPGGMRPAIRPSGMAGSLGRQVSPCCHLQCI